ncbi:hypothetical protein J3456_11930 [Sulfitobacter sp. NFXS29]|uniref:hypothetical protein n=1 Tax=Sulfitobacter sp. NFXS29 TaxID=2818438 RepID=UPI0032DF4399
MDPDTWIDEEFAYRLGLLEADFDRYITGDKIPVGMEPYDKGDNAFMARVDPAKYGIWTIRSVAPRPGLRVFGAFIATDIFIALTVRKRAELGGRGDRRWNTERENALAHWDRLFPETPPLTGGKLDDYFTEQAIAV